MCMQLRRGPITLWCPRNQFWTGLYFYNITRVYLVEWTMHEIHCEWVVVPTGVLNALLGSNSRNQPLCACG